jgi:hypothetical protein
MNEKRFFLIFRSVINVQFYSFFAFHFLRLQKADNTLLLAFMRKALGKKCMKRRLKGKDDQKRKKVKRDNVTEAKTWWGFGRKQFFKASNICNGTKRIQ